MKELTIPNIYVQLI